MNTQETEMARMEMELALQLYAADGDMGRVYGLLEQGVDINCSNRQGYTPLMRAAKAGHVGTAKLLLANGADPAAAMPDGRTAWDFANAGNHVEMAGLIAAYGGKSGLAERKAQAEAESGKPAGIWAVLLPLFYIANLAIFVYSLSRGSYAVLYGVRDMVFEKSATMGFVFCAVSVFSLICLLVARKTAKVMPKGHFVSCLGLVAAFGIIIAGGSVCLALLPVCLGGAWVVWMNDARVSAFAKRHIAWLPLVILFLAPTICLVCVEVWLLGAAAALVAFFRGLAVRSAADLAPQASGASSHV